MARQIRELGTGNSPQHVLRLGELVYRELHAVTRTSEAGDHRASLRRIAAHPDVPFKVTTIWRAVSVYEMSLRLPHLLQEQGLGISHLRAVIGLDASDQELLLTLAARERWTKRRLEQEAARRRNGDRRRGRRPLPKLTLWARDLDRLLERSNELGRAQLPVSETAYGEVTEVLDRLEARVSEVRKQLRIVGGSADTFGASEPSETIFPPALATA